MDTRERGTGKTGIEKQDIVKIVVCDDDRTMQDILRRKIEKHCEAEETACQILCVDSGEALLEADGQLPDIVFLDIQMPGRDGMETARRLRSRDSGIVLIFVTALSEYVYEAFDVGALHYLVKPFSDEKFCQVLDRALQQHTQEREIKRLRQKAAKGQEASGGVQDQSGEHSEFILVKRGGVSTRVMLADLIYAEVFNRKVMLHTTHGDIEYYGKLTDLSEKAGGDFYRTHRAYLVNFRYVERYTATTVWLERGTALVSKKQFGGFVRQYMQYINQKRSR